ncbi:MAG: hypothetical protein Ct9H300mP22_6330 [Gammaproteobacteria bacterium]|nr:MAG: hypothetical protein Ct9H300mP22_6330 [Gammaproteobacteria bacterium]
MFKKGSCSVCPLDILFLLAIYNAVFGAMSPAPQRLKSLLDTIVTSDTVIKFYIEIDSTYFKMVFMDSPDGSRKLRRLSQLRSQVSWRLASCLVAIILFSTISS